MITIMRKIYLLLTLTLSAAMTACVMDKGNYDLVDVNDVEIEGIEESYSLMAKQETLEIPITLKGTLSGASTEGFEFEWFICSGALSASDHKHTTISKDKDLVFPLDIAPGTYTIYCRVTDTTTKMQFEKYTTLVASSPYTRGFYIYGDKADGTVGMDFLSMIPERDSVVISNVFNNSKGIKGAEDLIFTGNYYNPANVSLWAVTADGSYSLEFESSLSEFNIREDVNPDNFLFPQVPVKKPIKVVDVHPHAWGPTCYNASSSRRYLFTEESGMYYASIIGGEYYGNPVSCYTVGSSDLVNISKYSFYKASSSFVSALGFYDKTNKRFVRPNGYTMTCLAAYTEKATDPFNCDQKSYTPERDLVYGENGQGNAGRSYALMSDTDGNYYVYCFVIASYTATGMTKQLARQIDLSVAKGFDKASQYTFFSYQPIVLYSVGNELWGYNYYTNTAELLKTFDADITYLRMDYHSGGNPTDFIVATWSSAEKGTIRKFEIGNSPDVIVIREKDYEYETEHYPWKTDLKVVKMEYRYCTL